MPGAIVCPPKNDQRFKDLVEKLGDTRAHIAFFRNGSAIPELEAAKIHLSTRPADYSLLAPPESKTGPVESEKAPAESLSAPLESNPVPIQQQSMDAEQAKARLVEIDKAIEDLDAREVKLGPYKKNVAQSLQAERRQLLEERLQRQGETGSTEAIDALMRYHEETQKHDDAGQDDDSIVRKFFESHPIGTPTAFEAAGHEHATEVRLLHKESDLPKRALVKGFRAKGTQKLDVYGQDLAQHLMNEGSSGAVTDPATHFTEAGVINRIKEAYRSPERSRPMPPVIETRRAIVPSAPPRSEVVKPEPFEYGPVIEGEPSIDFRTAEGVGDYEPADWARELTASLKAGERGSKAGNRADTRVGVALQGPDGRVILAGLVKPQHTPRVGRVARALGEVAVQRMGADRGGERTIDPTGNRPALVEDVVAAGFKPIAVIHFDGEPSKIFRTYDSAQAFDEAWRVSEKTQGRQIQAPEVRGTVTRAARTEKDIQGQIDDIGRRYEAADPEEQKAMVAQLEGLYEELDRTTRTNQDLNAAGADVPFRTMQETEHLMPVSANRAHEFQAVAGRLRNQGGRVDEFAKEFFAQGSADVIQKQIQSLEQKLQGAKGPAKKALQEAIDYRTQRIKDLKDASGVTFNPWHIAIAMNDVQQADVGDLVRLLHEASEQAAMRLPLQMRGTIARAVDRAVVDLRARAAAASEQTGVPLARETGAIDLLSETIAQHLAAAGIPDHPTVVAQIMRWVKDLYYRVSMAAQKAFGHEPDPKLALDWFENQMNRLVHGDYDQRLGRILDRFLRESPTEISRRFTGHAGTPGGLTDFFDPIEQTLRQPWVEPTGSEALKWNIAFRTDARSPGGELDIPDPEARARIDSAALNDLVDFADGVHQKVAVDLKWEQFWAAIGRGEDPKKLIADQEARIKGSKGAKIGGEGMTKVMDGLAQLRARQLLEKFHFRAIRESAKAKEMAEASADALTAAAREANKLEGDFRNAALHDDVLRAKAKDLVKELVRDYSRGLDTAETHGELARAVRESEGLLESDAVPERFQKVFKAISDGSVSIFGYMREISKLDLDLGNMTNREVLKAIRENAPDTPVLEELSQNRPLAVALAVLARKNAEQVDQIQLGWLRNMEQFQAIHRDLEEIRDATPEKLRTMQATMNERIKARGLRDRLNQAYLKKRRDLRTAQARVERSTARAELLDKVIPFMAKKVEQMQIEGAGAPSEWSPRNGADWTTFSLQDDGSWKKQTRVLKFNPDGSAVDSAGIRRALVQNREWLEQNKERKGSKLYETVKRQTTELAHLDVQRKYEAGHVNWLDRWVQPIGDEAAALGGAGARVKQMLLNFQRIMYFHNSEVGLDSHAWSRALLDVEAEAKLQDHGQFFSQVYQPVLYFLGTNPGLEEGPAIRQATRMARARLAKPPGEGFNEKFAEFLRRTKAASDRIESIAQKEGAFVKDPRLKSELRNAVARGWITAMRGVDGATVTTIIRDMEKAGWRLQMKDETGPDGKRRQSVVKATTFDHFTPGDVDEKSTEGLRSALGTLFTPGIVQRWLLPFINKGGIEVFKHEGDAIPQADVQQAWQDSGGDVVGWIDALAARRGIEPGNDDAADEEGVDEVGEKPMTLGEFRMSMLHQLNGLFGMESRMAYDSAQTRSMFDPMGPKPHVVMDARQNDLLPAEHLRFQSFDPASSRMVLGQVAFHAAFGRNGERMIAAVNELKSGLASRHAEYQSLKGTTRSARVAEAAARGWKYKELEQAARRYDSAVSMQQKLEGIFGVNNPAGPFNDMRGGMEVLHAMAGQIVDNPKVGLYHVISLLERPFAMKSLGPMTVRASAGAMGDFFKTAMGSMLESLNLHLLHSSEWAKEVGAVQGSAFRNQPWSAAIADIGQRGRFQGTKADRWLIRPLRMLRYIQQKGVRVGPGEGAREFPRFAPIPGMGVLNTIMQIAGTANTNAQVQMMETLVTKGIRYFSNHREDYENPAFRFKSGDLVGKWDAGVFDTLRSKTVEYGMGPIEDVVRAAMPAAAKGERLLNKDQVLRLSMMAANELDGATSINTTPSILQSNPLLRIGMPLLRWPLWKMHQTHEGLKNAAGRQDFVSVAKGLGTLALWNLPMGLAFSFLMDKYDEDLLHKKSNLPPLDATAAIPIVGPGLALATSDRSIPSNLLAFLERGAKAGNIYGLAADMVSQFAAPYDPNSGQRQFSLDQRVLVMSQFLNFQQAVRNLVNQGGDTTWASFWKPFMQSLGGNGALQAVDLVNNALGLDNAESRLVSRINAQNWLRSAGEEAGVELRGAGGASEAPTQTSVWIREMQLAAMAGDRMGFLDAHRKALNAARRAVSDDPRIAIEDREREANARVITSWKSRDPREVFRFKPTPAQLAEVYANMDDQGQKDVQQAIQRYDQFSALIQATPFERMIDREMRTASREPGHASARARQGASMLFASP